MDKNKIINTKVQLASEIVLEWIEDYIENNELGEGDTLPREIDIAEEVGVSRSSVREALTALKALGIIMSRRKGGITIIREPVLLGIRKYLVDQYQSRKRYDDAMEFRSVLEWGLGELVFSNIKKGTIAELRKIVMSVVDERSRREDINAAEKEFHEVLTKASGNNLSSLLTNMYSAVFETWNEINPESALSEEKTSQWLESHLPLVEALEKKDKDAFLSALKTHTFYYMRFLDDESRKLYQRKTK